MENKVIQTFPGSPRPEDLFTPYLPEVDLPADLDAVFNLAREQSAAPGSGSRGQRAVGIVTPGRMIMAKLCPLPGTMSKASGVRENDVLIVDSGMLPFIRKDWFPIAQRVMRPGGRIYIHSRPTFSMMPVARSESAQGWQYSEHDGEGSYANCLLTTFVKGKCPSVTVTSGSPLPDLSTLTTDPEELDWIAGLPFRYDALIADKVMKVILRASGWRWHHFFKTRGIFRFRLALGNDEWKSGSVDIELGKDPKGRKQLRIIRQS